MHKLVISLLLLAAGVEPAATQECLYGWLCRGTAAQINSLSPPEKTLGIIYDADSIEDCDGTGGGVEMAWCAYLSNTWSYAFSRQAGTVGEPTNLELLADHACPEDPPPTEAHVTFCFDRATGELVYNYDVTESRYRIQTDRPRSYQPYACATPYGGTYFDAEDQVLCVCANDGTDDAWLSSADYSHATGHCSFAPPALLTLNLVFRGDFGGQQGTQTLYDLSTNEYNSRLGNDPGLDGEDPTWTAYALQFATNIVDDIHVETPPIGSEIQSIDALVYLDVAYSPATARRYLLATSINDEEIVLGNSECTTCPDALIQIRSGDTECWSSWEASGQSIPAGWHMLQFNWDSGNSSWEIYLDGSEKATSELGETNCDSSGNIGAPWATGQAYTIGGNPDRGDNNFTGRIAWLDFYSTARSDGDLEQSGQAIVAARPGLKIAPYVFEALP